MSFEIELISGCINDKNVVDKVLRSGIDSAFFEDDFQGYIFAAIEDLYDIDNVSLSAIEKIVSNDKELTDSNKSLYIKMARKYAKTDYKDINLSFNRLLKERRKKGLLDGIKNAAFNMKNGEGVQATIDQLTAALSELNANTMDYEVYEYWSQFEERQEKRFTIQDDVGNRLKFDLNFQEFQRYFPLGLPPGTTLTIGGPTFVGKSVFLSNIVRMACDPVNAIDTILIVAENSADQTNSRLDSIYLDKPYLDIFDESKSSRADTQFFQSALDKGYGRLWTVKVGSNQFDTDTLRSVIHEARAAGMDPKVLVIDSPDHQMSKTKSHSWWEGKKDVYWENKNLAEAEEIAIVCSAPMKPSSVKGGSPTPEDIAGAYDIARIVDFMIMFNVDAEDKILGRAKLVVTKNREYGIIDKQDICFRFKESLLLIPYEESLQTERLESGRGYKIRRRREEAEEDE